MVYLVFNSLFKCGSVVIFVIAIGLVGGFDSRRRGAGVGLAVGLDAGVGLASGLGAGVALGGATWLGGSHGVLGRGGGGG